MHTKSDGQTDDPQQNSCSHGVLSATYTAHEQCGHTDRKSESAREAAARSSSTWPLECVRRPGLRSRLAYLRHNVMDDINSRSHMNLQVFN